GNTIQGNFIGTDPTGTLLRRNLFDGVRVVLSSDNLIGGTAPAARNLLSGNGTGVSILNGTGNRVEGNFIGTDVSGAGLLAGFQASNGTGVVILAASSNKIGGTAAGARNIISGNGGGIDI